MAVGQQETRIRGVAQERLGFERLRAGQEEVVRSLLDGHDTLAVMPTGSGKTAIYEIAGEILAGPTLVVSPLIALQRDQVEAIAGQDVGSAVHLNSSLSAGEHRDILERFVAGRVEFLLLAPEQLAKPEVLERLRRGKPSLFVVDEAHCISEWGHDFRPDYLRLGTVIEMLGHPRVLALTATATPPVRVEILERLRMRDARVVVHGFDRPNIWLGVEHFGRPDDKREAVLQRVAQARKPGIIYVATRRHAEDVAEALRERGVGAEAYHAGMRKGERERVQDAFMHGRSEVIVATKAFGMGIDKPDIRFVFHHDISGSLDSHYQEIGRAGRDGEPARAILFYYPKDLGLQRYFAASGRVGGEDAEHVAQAVQAHDAPVSLREVREETGLSREKVTSVINRLEEAGAVETCATGDVAVALEPPEAGEVAHEVEDAEALHRQFEESRVEMMRGYAQTRGCRREYLLSYFGERYPAPCGNCDNCDAGITRRHDQADEPFPLNSRVVHNQWGEGLVLRYEGGTMTVLFDTVGYKNLSVETVTDRGLLQPSG